MHNKCILQGLGLTVIMENEIEKFLNYVQSSTPLAPEGGVRYYFSELYSKEEFSEQYKHWFPEFGGEAPVLNRVIIEVFSKQLAATFWSCFAWPGKKPDTTKAQVKFLEILSNYYSLKNTETYFSDEDGYGEFCFLLPYQDKVHAYIIEWLSD